MPRAPPQYRSEHGPIIALGTSTERSGRLWHGLAHSGTLWHTLAHSGTTLAQSGTDPVESGTAGTVWHRWHGLARSELGDLVGEMCTMSGNYDLGRRRSPFL